MSEPREPAWTEDNSRRWLADIDARERQLEPLSDVLFDYAELQPGDVVLDVGCGSGVTTARAAALVAPEVGGHPVGLAETGRVVGNDVSAAMIEAARERHPRSAIEWLVADAERHDFGTGVFDAIISRLGVMFFADPGVAFTNLAGATRAGGRLVAAVWQRRAAVEFFWVPQTVARGVLDRAGVDYPEPLADGTGPFSLSDPGEVSELLSRSGWSSVWCHADSRPVYLGGPGDPEHAVAATLRTAMMESLLSGQSDEIIAQVRAGLLQMARERHDGAGVPLATGVWIVTATRAG